MMRAVQVARFGGPDVLKVVQLAIPKPKEKEILINIKAAGVNPVDTYIRTGTYGKGTDLPYTPGKDGAGIIEQIGSTVTKFKPGDRVWFLITLTGSYAEYALCSEDMVRHLPDSLTFEQGASVGIPYLTAHRALFHTCKGKANDVLLIHGASGAVGIAASQIARAQNMMVLGTAGSEEGLNLLKSTGVHHVFNHRVNGYIDEIKKCTEGKGVNIILEMLANVNLTNDLNLASNRGRIAVIGSRGPIEIFPRNFMTGEKTVTGVQLFNSTKEEMNESFEAIQQGLEQGTLSPIVGARYSLEDACIAHKDIIETKAAKGKIVLVTSKI